MVEEHSDGEVAAGVAGEEVDQEAAPKNSPPAADEDADEAA